MSKKNSTISIIPDPVIQGLFPTPVLFTNFNREWTKEEKKFFEKTAKSTTQNSGNTTSADRYVLDHPVMKDIKQYYQYQFFVEDFPLKFHYQKVFPHFL